jgi:hypothetical protein
MQGDLQEALKSFRFAEPKRKLRWIERGRETGRPMEFSARTWSVEVEIGT